MFRPAEPVGRRQRAASRAARISRTGDDQFGIRVDAGPSRQSRLARGSARTFPRNQSRGRRSDQRGLRRRLRGRTGAGRGQRDSGRRDRDFRHIDRRLDGRRGESTVRFRSFGEASQGRSGRNRQERHRHSPHRPIGGISRRPPRPGRNDSPPCRVLRSRRRLPLCAGAADHERHQSSGRIRGAEAGECPCRRRLHDRRRTRRGGSAADQRRRRAGAHGVDGIFLAAKEIAENGTFSALGRAIPFATINGYFERK